MIPPKGFKNELYPLRHKVLYSCGLSLATGSMNSCFFTLVRHTSDVIAGVPEIIEVNPHNTNYNEETGPAVVKMSILDKIRISLRFNMTNLCDALKETAAGAFTGDGIKHLKLLWRPVFFSFPEKLKAVDDDTGNSVATILALVSDDVNEDVAPLTTNKLPVVGVSDLPQAVSTVNIVEVFGDYGMTTDTDMEDHVWDETLFQNALRRFTNKGALKACVGRTRHVNLTQTKPYMNFYLDKFVPKAIRRVVDRTFMGIQIHMPLAQDIGQDYFRKNLTGALAHVGVKCICTYHEWNSGHFQDMTGTGT